jgi:PEP-CTERM/exosortase A-associated glycosyltransferase
VYEVRAFWEDALLQPNRTGLMRAKYQYARSLETRLFKQADAVVAISKHMVDEIASRGIERSRLHVMPNGVDPAQFAPRPYDEALAARLGLTGRTIIGFIGSFYKFEGLDCLVNAMPAVIARLPDARLVLVGTGDEDASTRRLVTRLGLQDYVLLTGRVPHEQIQQFYSVMDVLVYPRHRDRVTELVTPLKPLEAMALGKPVIGSDVGGIRELLDDGKAGALFKAGDSADLASAIVALLTDSDRRAMLVDRAREYVRTRRTWESLVRAYLPIYQTVCAANGVVDDRFRAELHNVQPG